jgi:hypothetical protein
MRRRIYIDPESGLQDNTGMPYLWDVDEDFEPQGTRTGALYDEDLWQEYLNACEHADNLRRIVISKLVNEPFDDVERTAAEEAQALVRQDDFMVRMSELERQVLAHARSQRPK